MVDVSTSAPGQVPVVLRSDAVSQVRGMLATVPTEDDGNPRKRRARRPRLISGPDESALSWYFGQGLSIYEKSTFGPIVQKIQMEGFSSTVCGRCEGAGILEVGGVNLDDRCRGCKGTGHQPRKDGESLRWCFTCGGVGRTPPEEVEVAKGGWCPSCRGTGTGSVERRAMRRVRCAWCRPDPYVTAKDETGEIVKASLVTAWVPRHSCANCLGTGDEPISAKPVQVAEDASGMIGNDTALTRFAVTSRRADVVKAGSEQLHAALHAFYGDTGQRWALTQMGRLFALFHLTPAGKKLARFGIPTEARAKLSKAERKRLKGKKKPPEQEQLPLSALERIGIQAILQLSQPKPDRKLLLDAAREQAADIYTRAANAWNATSIPKSDQLVAKRLHARGHTGTAKLLLLSAGGAR